MKLTPTNGFGTYMYGQFQNLSCNNASTNTKAAGLLIRTNLTNCTLGLTIHNSFDKPTQRQSPFDWQQILGNTKPPFNYPCAFLGTLYNPMNNTNPLGFLGNLEVFNGTATFSQGPYNFTLDNKSPLSVSNLPMVIWSKPIKNPATLPNEMNPSQILSCGLIKTN